MNLCQFCSWSQIIWTLYLHECTMTPLQHRSLERPRRIDQILRVGWSVYTDRSIDIILHTCTCELWISTQINQGYVLICESTCKSVVESEGRMNTTTPYKIIYFIIQMKIITSYLNIQCLIYWRLASLNPLEDLVFRDIVSGDGF